MIIGIGTDIVQIRRIELSIRRWGHKFLNRIFTQNEQKGAERLSPETRMAYYAKRFAAKEAFLKAVGLGIGRGIAMTEVAVGHDEMGAPHYVLTGAAQQKMLDMGAQRAWLSLSHETGMAAAVCVIE